MKTEFAFDICWEIYKGAREVLETKRGLYAFELSSSNEKYLWRPDLRPRLSEYVADFALVAVGGPGTPHRRQRIAAPRNFPAAEIFQGAVVKQAPGFVGTWASARNVLTSVREEGQCGAPNQT
jgi:hypothetical protein